MKQRDLALSECNESKGFALIYILIAAVVLAAIGGVYWFYNDSHQIKYPMGVVQPDTKTMNEQSKKVIQEKTSKTASSDSDISNWKTYTIDKYKLSFKYPQKWDYMDCPGSRDFECASFLTEGMPKQGNSGSVFGSSRFDLGVINGMENPEWFEQLNKKDKISEFFVSGKKALKTNSDLIKGGWDIDIIMDPTKRIFLEINTKGLAEAELNQILSTFKFD
ncbi:MAG: hypothetical protein V1808_04110 [Candidatus Daviesbacteria bacterium]